MLSGEAGLNLHANMQALPGGYRLKPLTTGAVNMGPEMSISPNTLGAGFFKPCAVQGPLKSAERKKYLRNRFRATGDGRLEQSCLLLTVWTRVLAALLNGM